MISPRVEVWEQGRYVKSVPMESKARALQVARIRNRVYELTGTQRHALAVC